MKRTLLALGLLLPAAAFAGAMTASEKAKVLDSLREHIRDHYVQVGHIDRIDATLQALAKTERFKAITEPRALARLLTDELQRHDKHFGVQWQDRSKPQAQRVEREDWFSKLDRKNFGFNKVEILDGNVGYLAFWGFDNLDDEARKTVEHLMGFLGKVDAMIIDLRRNGGGSAEMVQLLSSYFLDTKTHLNSFYSRESGSTTEFWTLDDVQSPFARGLPLYVLTSAETFSAAEEFAYNFKQLKRATLVGETTRGGANPWRYYPLVAGFRAGIPNAMAVNPITKSNWEGVGVKPHVAASSEQALDRAYLLALEAIRPSLKDGYQLKEIDAKLAELRSGE
ncbi:S41 family peptidase [Gallaecimonas sp. GXIMD4217]|uniref:S41 family peptidase n=1 Tax=Gallaecimonas sp. GXIMD4217 TaxID=3131927 RepID=UPI00311AE4DD